MYHGELWNYFFQVFDKETSRNKLEESVGEYNWYTAYTEVVLLT